MTIQFEGIKVSYRSEGRGMPLVLLHGYPENSGHLGFLEETERSAGLITDFARKLDWQKKT